MQLRDYGRVLARRWILLVLLVLVGAGSAYIYSKTQTPIYRSTARLFIDSSRNDYGQTLFIQNGIRSYSQRLQSEVFLQKIVSQLKLDISPGELRGKIGVTGTGDNFAIDLTVDDPNPLEAQRIARAMADTFVQDQRERQTEVPQADRIDFEVYDFPKPGDLNRPRTSVNASAGAALGLVLGLVLAFVLEYLDDTIKTVEMVERFLGLPLLGTIPRLFTRSQSAQKKGGGRPVAGGSAMTNTSGNSRLINHRNPRSPAAEAYRQLRTNIQFSSLDKELRTLAFTSSLPQEGKSTTLANLAITMAQNGNRVIVVDCDLRRPTQHSLFGLKNQVGLTNLMVAPSLDDLNTQETDVPGLYVLPTGPIPPNPSELLGSRRMMEVIHRLSQEADYVLFDTPPVVAVTDAAVLATKVDGVVLVVMANKTKRDVAQRAKAQLEKVGANIVGVVLNNVKYDTSVHDYYAGGQ